LEKAPIQITLSRESVSNVNEESDVQPEKEHHPRNSTDDGRQSDSNDEQREKAFASIRASFDPNSNVSEESDSQRRKAFLPRNSTEAGRQSDFNE
jgi:hypothetical protein